VAMLDSPTEILAIALNYLKLPPDTSDPAAIEKAKNLLLGVRKNINAIRNDNIIDSLATGDACLQLGYSGDVVNASSTAKTNKTGVNIAYSIPKEGTVVFFDSMAIPVDAPHADAAHKFINFILKPEVIAGVTNEVNNANAVPASKALLEPDIANNPGIYPNEATMAGLVADVVVPDAVTRLRTRAWTEIRTGK
jgi:putrescine transport system substrate-binding protein